MISGILSLLFGIFGVLSSLSAFPVLGLALGANAVLKERKKEHKKKSVIIVSVLGIIINGFVTFAILIFILGKFLKRV